MNNKNHCAYILCVMTKKNTYTNTQTHTYIFKLFALVHQTRDAHSLAGGRSFVASGSSRCSCFFGVICGLYIFTYYARRSARGRRRSGTSEHWYVTFLGRIEFINLNLKSKIDSPFFFFVNNIRVSNVYFNCFRATKPRSPFGSIAVKSQQIRFFFLLATSSRKSINMSKLLICALANHDMVLRPS